MCQLSSFTLSCHLCSTIWPTSLLQKDNKLSRDALLQRQWWSNTPSWSQHKILLSGNFKRNTSAGVFLNHTLSPLFVCFPLRLSLIKVHCWPFQLEYEDSGSSSDFCDEDCLGKGGPLIIKDYRAAGDHLDLREIFFSNEEYYSKLEELKNAHLRTMAELERMYRRKLQLKSLEPLDMTTLDVGQRWVAFTQDYVRDSVLILLVFSCLRVCLTVIVWV